MACSKPRKDNGPSLFFSKRAKGPTICNWATYRLDPRIGVGAERKGGYSPPAAHLAWLEDKHWLRDSAARAARVKMRFGCQVGICVLSPKRLPNSKFG